jgi:hypothetical protein
MHSKVIFFAVFMLFTGSINTIATKYQVRAPASPVWSAP